MVEDVEARSRFDDREEGHDRYSGHEELCDSDNRSATRDDTDDEVEEDDEREEERDVLQHGRLEWKDTPEVDYDRTKSRKDDQRHGAIERAASDA